MSGAIFASAAAAAASQSTVAIVLADAGGSASTTNPGGSASGKVFGTAIFSVSNNFGTQLLVRLNSTNSGQSFFRQVRVNSSILLSTSNATYSSGTDTWTWTQAVGAGSYTFQFFR